MSPLKTLKFRLLSSYIVVLTFSLPITAFLLDRSLERHAMADLRASMETQARLAAAQLDPQPLTKEDAGRVDALVKRLGASAGSRMTVISASGRVLGDSDRPYAEMLRMGNHLDRAEIAEAAAGGVGSATRHSGTLNKEMLYLAAPVRAGGRLAGFVRLAMPLSGVERMLSSLRRTIVFSFALSALFALATGWLLIRLAAGPFAEIIQGSKRFAAGDFGYRIPLRSSGELRKLSETLNTMAAEISRRMREAELRRLELEAAFRDMPEAIMVTNGAGVITRLNPRAERLLGVAGSGGAGLRLSEVPAGAELAGAALKALSTGQPVSFELEPPGAPGVRLSVNASPIAGGGAVGGCVLTARDVTEARRLEELRRDFVANVSHELKTPLTSIRGCAETLLDGALSDKENGPGFVRSIHEQALRLDGLVGDLLKLSYAESGRSVLQRSEFVLRELGEETARGLKHLLEKKRVRFANAVPEDLRLSADRDKILQVLANLLDNAAKYSPEGASVTLSAEDLDGRVRVAVADSGPGIPAGHLHRVFERFYRVDKARSRELGGTGLGLSIVKHLVEQHGGAAGVDSAPGAGSTFWFILPKP